MSTTKTVKCDGKDCKAVKEGANYWHRARVVTMADTNPFMEIGDIPGVEVFGGKLGANIITQLLDFCSERCLTRYVSRFIGQDQKEQRYVEPAMKFSEILTEDDAPF